MKWNNRKIWKVMQILLGNLFYAAAVKFFVMPLGLLTGGSTGIALAVQHAFGIPVSGFVLVFNILMLMLGWIILGKKFALSTMMCTFAYPIMLQLLDILFGDLILTEDNFLGSIFAGIGIGISLGIVLRAGASTGGMDIPPLVLHHFWGVNVSVSMYVFDFLILIAQAFQNTVDRVLYGIIVVMIYTLVLDKMLLIGTSRTEVKIMSNHIQEIRAAIIEQMDRGVTMLSAESGYMREDTQMVLSVISNRELPQLERIIREIDPESFMIVSSVKEVKGRGFTQKKIYKNLD